MTSQFVSSSLFFLFLFFPPLYNLPRISSPPQLETVPSTVSSSLVSTCPPCSSIFPAKGNRGVCAQANSALHVTLSLSPHHKKSCSCFSQSPTTFSPGPFPPFLPPSPQQVAALKTHQVLQHPLKGFFLPILAFFYTF